MKTNNISINEEYQHITKNYLPSIQQIYLFNFTLHKTSHTNQGIQIKKNTYIRRKQNIGLGKPIIKSNGTLKSTLVFFISFSLNARSDQLFETFSWGACFLR